MLIISLIFLLISIFILIVFATYAYSGISAAPWVPTRSFDVRRMLDLADIRKGQKVFDLGCGDGRLVVAAAEKGAEAKGFEISLLMYLMANIRRLFIKNKGYCEIIFKSFWSEDISDADIIFIFLMPFSIKKLKEKFQKELKKEQK